MPKGHHSSSRGPAVKLDGGYKEVLETLYLIDDYNVQQVTDYLREELQLNVSKRSVERALSSMNIRKKMSIHSLDSPELRCRIADGFYYEGLEQDELLQVLHEEGFEITSRQLSHIRKKMGLMYRLKSQEDIAATEELLRQTLEEEYKKGTVYHYGREYMYRHLRTKGILVNRGRMFRIMKDLNPEGIQARVPAFIARRNREGKYVLPGPNCVWSVDGHLKLKQFGICIYGMVDGYSRYVVSCYVGSSVTTQIGTLKQYCETIERLGYRPVMIRSDRGTETQMMGNAHWQMAQATDPLVSFDAVYKYGTSKVNSRIETWWNHISKGLLQQWRFYFHTLATVGDFIIGDESCLIAVAFLYMDIIREQVRQFVHMWNIHKIRAQSRRPYLIPGKPIMNYMHPKIDNPNAEDFAVPIDSELLAGLKNYVADYDPQKILSTETERWCQKTLEEGGFERPTLNNIGDIQFDGISTHNRAYIYLKNAIRAHMQSGNTNPQLLRMPAPTGGYRWIERLERPPEEEKKDNEMSFAWEDLGGYIEDETLDE